MSYTGLSPSTNYTWFLPTGLKNYNKRQELFKIDSKNKRKISRIIGKIFCIKINRYVI